MAKGGFMPPFLLSSFPVLPTFTLHVASMRREHRVNILRVGTADMMCFY